VERICNNADVKYGGARMNKFYKLSDTEMDIMKVIWGLATPVTISQLLSVFESHKWKIQTMASFLTRLSEKGLIIVDKQYKANRYSPAITEQKYNQLEALNLLNTMYNGSVKGFVAALYGDGDIDLKEVEDLKNWFDKVGE
jgi:predicted transcriptional regulator